MLVATVPKTFKMFIYTKRIKCTYNYICIFIEVLNIEPYIQSY